MKRGIEKPDMRKNIKNKTTLFIFLLMTKYLFSLMDKLLKFQKNMTQLYFLHISTEIHLA